MPTRSHKWNQNLKNLEELRKQRDKILTWNQVSEKFLDFHMLFNHAPLSWFTFIKGCGIFFFFYIPGNQQENEILQLRRVEQILSWNKIHGIRHFKYAVAGAISREIAPLIADVSSDPVALCHQLFPDCRFEHHRTQSSVYRISAQIWTPLYLLKLRNHFLHFQGG